jgi:hypothetical protein
MIPNSGMTALFYPMTANVCYSIEDQNDFGEITKTWVNDRTIRCSAIKNEPSSGINKSVQTQAFLTYSIIIDLRTKEDILVSSDGLAYRPTEILITNIKDDNGNIIWKETIDEPTNFEVLAIEPMFDPFHKLDGNRIMLGRADLQVNINV